MSLRTLARLQWVGLFAGGATWWAQHVLGFGITQARCGAGGVRWGIDKDLWEGALLGVTVALILAAEAAAVAVLLGTRDASYESAPPGGRIRFFAIAALAANAIFLVIVLLDGFASIVGIACRQG